MLHCPSCHLAIRAVLQDDFEIDVCDACGGVWLDVEELETLSNGAGFVPHEGASRAIASLRCPRCDTTGFVEHDVEEGVLARCADCGGLFVEGPTIERLADVRRPRPASPFGRTAGRATIDGLLLFEIMAGLLG